MTTECILVIIVLCCLVVIGAQNETIKRQNKLLKEAAEIFDRFTEEKK